MIFDIFKNHLEPAKKSNAFFTVFQGINFYQPFSVRALGERLWVRTERLRALFSPLVLLIFYHFVSSFSPLLNPVTQCEQALLVEPTSYSSKIRLISSRKMKWKLCGNSHNTTSRGAPPLMVLTRRILVVGAEPLERAAQTPNRLANRACKQN